MKKQLLKFLSHGVTKTKLIGVLFCISFSTIGQIPIPLQWQKSYGFQLKDMISTPDKGFLIAGVLNNDYALAKIDSSGNKVWEKTFGGTHTDNFKKIIKTKDGNYILAGTSNSGLSGSKTQASRGDFDYWIIKITPEGVKIWDKTFGGAVVDDLTDIIEVSTGGYLLGGSSNSSIGGDKSEPGRKNVYHTHENFDYWIVKTDNNGNKLWDKTIGGASNIGPSYSSGDFLTSLIELPNKNFLIGGYSGSIKGFERTADKVCDLCDWNPEGNGALDYWIVKVDANGNKLQDQSYTNIRSSILSKIVPTLDGGYILTGTSGGGNSRDVFLVKIDQNLAKIWGKTLNNPLPPDMYGFSGYQALDVDYTSSGIYISGTLSNSSVGLAYGTVLKFSYNGIVKWNYKNPQVAAYYKILIDSDKEFSLLTESTFYKHKSINSFEAEDIFSPLSDVGSHPLGVENHPHLSGGSSAKLWDIGDKIRLTFYSTAGEYLLKVRIRTPNKTSFFSNGYSFWVNGAATSFKGNIASIEGPYASYGGSYWGEMSAPVTLTGGKNVLDVQTNLMWQGVDYIELVPLKLEAENIFLPYEDVEYRPLGVENHTALSGGSSAKLWDANDQISLAFTVTPGNYLLKVRVRARNQTSFFNNGYTFYYNSRAYEGKTITMTGDISSISPFNASYGGSYWGDMVAPITVTEELNYLNVRANLSWLGVDYIELVPVNSSTARVATDEETLIPATFLAYPNPLQGQLNLQFPSSINGKTSFILLDNYGKKIFTKTITAANQKEISIELPSNLRTGMYTLKIKGEGLDKTVKLSKE